MKNEKLNRAKVDINDEFYTKYEDISNFVKIYRSDFENKVIYCNCDDPRISKIYEFFKDNFKELNLKRIVSTFRPLKEENPFRTDFDGISEVKTTIKSGNFEDNCEIFEEFESDIFVITNPPFSIIKKYIDFISKFNCKFVFIGPITIYRKELIEYFTKDKIRPLTNDIIRRVLSPEGKLISANVLFFGNLEQKFNSKELNRNFDNSYKKFENFNCLYIDKTENIPRDYKELMAVPITSMYLIRRDEIEIYGISDDFHKKIKSSPQGYELKGSKYVKTDKLNKKLFIRDDFHKKSKYIIEGMEGKFRVPFKRIFIKLK